MLETNKKTRASARDLLINSIKLPPSSKLIFLFFLFILLYLLSFDSTRVNRIYSELNRDNLRAVNLFHQLSRKDIVKGTYHLTFTDVSFNFLRSIVYHNLDIKIVSLAKEWDHSNSYKNYEINYSELLNIITPLIPYLYPQNKYHQNILEAYNSLRLNEIAFDRAGYVESDFYPEKGPIDFSGFGGFALDAHNRSVGVDLGEVKKVAALRLYTYAGKYRIGSANLSLWFSNDNKAFFKYQRKLSIYFGSNSILIDQVDIDSRYLKVNCNFKDANYTFAEDLRRILKVYGPPIFPKSL
jgi:hypothetical protein